GRHIQLRGPSYRTRHQPKKEKSAPDPHNPPGARISGNVVPEFPEPTELPSDLDGVLYIPLDPAGAWRLDLAKEMKAAGLEVDMNKALP
ncbi:MAG: hypothetical protein Q8N53_14510, partial [Longimicrobiales bacterium]|nr:hypothetical protein [Longimicrobiales bacterium]